MLGKPTEVASFLPAKVRYHRELERGAKLLFSEIWALNKAQGHCFWDDAYFASVFDVHTRTIVRWRCQLKHAGLISYDRQMFEDLHGNIFNYKIINTNEEANDT